MKKKQKGQAMIIVAMVMITLICLLALVIDTGRIYIEHAKLQRTVDSMALASAQVLPNEQKARDVAKDAAELNKLNINNYEVVFSGPDAHGKNTAMVTAFKTLDTRLANFFSVFGRGENFSQWSISAQAIARNGPIREIQHWLPIGILDPTENITLYQHYRLTNTYHEAANSSDVKLMYVPINYGGNMRDGIRDNVATRVRIGQTFNIATNFNPVSVCDGIDDRIKNRLTVTGCFKVGQVIDLSKLNIIGPGSKKDWYFGEDPRLVYIPFVQQKNNNVEIVGFGLFYIEYSHYDPNPPGSGQPMTELVGFFVQSIVEGPIMNTAKNYGVIGIEYLKLDDFYKQ